MKRGRLIVIEGIDGSGKTTQIELLKEYLASQGVPLEVISFPRYEENIYGRLIKRYLEGEFGSLEKINPYLMACIFAGDRMLAKDQIEQWLSEGKIVIANRYVSSSKAHMGANLPEEKRAEFLSWLDELEYETNKIPKEDLTILLDIEPRIGQKNVLGRHTDLHEENLKHLEQASKIYLELAKKESNWYVTPCMTDGKMKSLEDIYQEIAQVLYDKI
ncbi:dTMP kinase [Candidatus Daviesbacteria bacterium RIFCSPLOWO2_02_FULL_36_7]|uniref:Thymidylate kinase n=1 Tax=Candidatus Daviesbacteria bacterium RIFCSPLOWO2_02_FULL_36_7 TaxID=1797792 RepID=A0A1F5MGD2_9BACT|nr:MAG: dTMP kinase [Candidatus Daviesbacteria bacterium RIFCSPLOWO2_02_FULL_36_7]